MKPKLALKRSTIRVLGAPRLTEVAGGQRNTIWDGCSGSCTNPNGSCYCETDEAACMSTRAIWCNTGG